MLFRSITASFFGILCAQGTLALTPADVVTNVGIVTSASGNLNSVLSGLSVTPTPQQAQTMSQTVVSGFQTIINSLAGDVTAMQATSPAFSDADAGPIVDALRDFVAVHQVLLSTVIGKHSIFAQFAVTAPIASILRTLEAGIDGFAFAMIDLIPTRTSAVTNDKNSLDSSVGNTISLYQQICIPSILYPAIPPICVVL